MGVENGQVAAGRLACGDRAQSIPSLAGRPEGYTPTPGHIHLVG